MQNLDFLTETFKNADAVYLMIAWDAIGNLFDKEIDFPTAFSNIAPQVQASGGAIWGKKSGVFK